MVRITSTTNGLVWRWSDLVHFRTECDASKDRCEEQGSWWIRRLDIQEGRGSNKEEHRNDRGWLLKIQHPSQSATRRMRYPSFEISPSKKLRRIRGCDYF